MVFLKEFFEKVDFEKKSADNKKNEEFSRGQRSRVNDTEIRIYARKFCSVLSGKSPVIQILQKKYKKIKKKNV